MKCCVCRNRGSSSSAFLWAVSFLLSLLYFLFPLVYRCIHFVVVFGTVGTGDYGYMIGMEVVAGRELGFWVCKGIGEGASKEQGRV